MATAAKETNPTLAAATQVTFLEAIRQAMCEEMERDPAVVLIGEDIGVYGGAFKTSEGLLERFGWERVIDTPISESAIIGAACGMSYLGLRPIAEMQFIDFIVCALTKLQISSPKDITCGTPLRRSSFAVRPVAACMAGHFTPQIPKCISCTRRD